MVPDQYPLGRKPIFVDIYTYLLANEREKREEGVWHDLLCMAWYDLHGLKPPGKVKICGKKYYLRRSGLLVVINDVTLCRSLLELKLT
jgi:hypothetical protein